MPVDHLLDHLGQAAAVPSASCLQHKLCTVFKRPPYGSKNFHYKNKHHEKERKQIWQGNKQDIARLPATPVSARNDPSNDYI